MIFQEIKKEKGYEYKCEDIFGSVTMNSEDKLDGDDLDLVIKTLLDKTISAKIIKGELLLKEKRVRYLFKKANPWLPEDEKCYKNTHTSTKKQESGYTRICHWITKKISTSWFHRFVVAYKEARKRY